MKRCVGCCNTKEETQFHRSTVTHDGLGRYCIQCCKVNRALESVRKRDKKSHISTRQRHRANTLNVECDDTITLAKVFHKDRGVCGLCKLWVQPRKASMDHITPLSKGGTHTWPNIQLTHLVCNLRKSNKVNYQP